MLSSFGPETLKTPQDGPVLGFPNIPEARTDCGQFSVRSALSGNIFFPEA